MVGVVAAQAAMFPAFERGTVFRLAPMMFNWLWVPAHSVTLNWPNLPSFYFYQDRFCSLLFTQSTVVLPLSQLSRSPPMSNSDLTVICALASPS